MTNDFSPASSTVNDDQPAKLLRKDEYLLKFLDRNELANFPQ